MLTNFPQPPPPKYFECIFLIRCFGEQPRQEDSLNHAKLCQTNLFFSPSPLFPPLIVLLFLLITVIISKIK